MKRMIILCLSLTLLLCACVPTPEVEPIAMRDRTPEATNYESLSVPTYVEQEAQRLNNASVAVCADVDAPKDLKPIVTQIEQAPVDRDAAQRFVEAFSDAPLYMMWTLTRREYLQQLVDFENMLQTEQSTLTGDRLKEQQEMDQMRVEWLKEQSETAPEMSEHQLWSWDDYTDGMTVSLWAEPAQGCSFALSDWLLSYQADRETYYYPKSGLSPDELPPFEHPKQTEQDAKAIALNALERLGMSDFAIIDRLTEYAVGERMLRYTDWGYCFRCTRTVGGLSAVYATGGSLNLNFVPAVGAPWDLETVTIIVTDAGIASFEWRNPIRVLPKTESASFVGFSEIVQNAVKTLLYRYAESGRDTDGIFFRITVDSIVLVCGTLQVQDQPDAGQIVPLWEIGYTVELPEGRTNAEVIYLNALDGTYVEPRMGLTAIMELLDFGG